MRVQNKDLCQHHITFDCTLTRVPRQLLCYRVFTCAALYYSHDVLVTKSLSLLRCGVLPELLVVEHCSYVTVFRVFEHRVRF